MKVLFVLEHYQPYIGGAEELFSGLANSLIKKGDKVTVVTTRHKNELPPNEFIEGVEVIRINCYNRFLFTFLSLPLVIKNARKADLIQTASYNAALPAFVAGLICRKKVIITFHEVWSKLWFSLPFTSKPLLFAYFIYEKLILKLPFHKYVAVSRSTFNALLKSGIEEYKIKLIYNGLDYSRFANVKSTQPHKFTFCFFGRLGISKGLEFIPEAFREIVKTNPDVQLKLIIPTYPKSVYRKFIRLINKYDLLNNIVIKHDLRKDDLIKEIAESSCILIPSHSEGFCFTATESAALNVPVISSGKGSLSEVVSGRHIHMKELSVEELSSAMHRAIRDDFDKSDLKQFPIGESVNSYKELYNDLLKN